MTRVRDSLSRNRPTSLAQRKRNAIKQNRMAQATTNTFRGQASGTVLMGVGDEEIQQKVESLRKLGVYDDKTKRHTQFMTTYEAEVVMNDLHDALLVLDGVKGD